MLNSVTEIDWPPAYIIKKHKRARYVKLRTIKSHGLQITIPYRFNLKNIPSILEENKPWIIKQLLLLQEQATVGMPDGIVIPVTNQTWLIEYIPSDTRLQLIERPHGELVITGPIHDESKCRLLLIKWLKLKAKSILLTQLQAVSQQAKLPFEALTIRDQKTLWGSCTSKRTISLNYKLILLPPALMIHIMIHELCHTKHMNHSTKFWQLVATHDSAWRENKRLMRKADQYLPKWL